MFEQHHALMVFSSFVCLGLLAVGYSVQEWDPEWCHTGGDHTKTCGVAAVEWDSTWGTWVTDYLLAAMCAVMAVMLPGAGHAKYIAAAAFGLDALSWLFDGVLHQNFAKTSDMTVNDSQLGLHVAFLLVVLIFRTVAIVLYAYAAYVLSGDVIKCMSTKTSGCMFGVAGVCFAIATMVSGLNLGMTTLAGFLVVAIFSVVGKLPKWSATIVALCALAAALNLATPPPFKYSLDYNHNALFLFSVALIHVAVFGMYAEALAFEDQGRELAQSLQAAEAFVADKAEVLKDTFAKDAGELEACCGCSGGRGSGFNK